MGEDMGGWETIGGPILFDRWEFLTFGTPIVFGKREFLTDGMFHDSGGSRDMGQGETIGSA